MATFETLTKSQRTRASLHRDVVSICREACHLLGLEITKPAMEIIAELLYKKISLYGLDLEAFAKHAKRSTVNTDDVKLLVRRNPSLKSHLNTVIGNQPTSAKDKRRKTNTALPTARETPKSKPDKESENNDKSKEDDDFEMGDQNENIPGNVTIDLTFD